MVALVLTLALGGLTFVLVERYARARYQDGYVQGCLDTARMVDADPILLDQPAPSAPSIPVYPGEAVAAEFEAACRAKA